MSSISSTESIGVLIGGEEGSTISGDNFTSIDPSTGEEVAQVALAGAEDVDNAVRAARRAQREWARRLPAERGRVLARIAPAIRERAEELVEPATRDSGLPPSGVRGDLELAARYFEYYSGLAEQLSGTTVPLGPGFLDYTEREPWGVVGVIMPFNSPYQLLARSVAPGLAAGNTVVVKTGEQAPVGPLLLVRLAVQAGLPAELVQVISGFGEAGASLAGHPDIDRIVFTGSRDTGQRVLALASQNMTPACLELGGKSPQVVFADADLEAAAQTIVRSLVYYAGQICTAGTRVIVERAAHADLVDAIESRLRATRIGPALEDPDLGPVINAQQRERVMAAIRAGEAEAKTVIGGSAAADEHPSSGFFVSPTLFDEVDQSSRLVQQEIFGPVLVVTEFADEHEAVELANGTEFGLASGLWTRDLERAHRVARAIQAGQVFVNNYRGGIEIPFGGYKGSGMGREKGVEGILEYTQIKNVCITVGPA
jgi:aldehyde dehydrogenase (NAD+)